MLAGDIKKNVCLRLDGRIYVVIDFLHVKPGKGNTVMRTKLRDVQDGRVLERTWIVSAKLEDVQVDHRQFQYLYKEGDDLVFLFVQAVIDNGVGFGHPHRIRNLHDKFNCSFPFGVNVL